jgi:uncharacterized RDD family membrane protein YckC
MSQAPQAYRGERLGLPAQGPGSIVDFSRRVVALIVDMLASGLVAALFVATFAHPKNGYSALPQNWSLAAFFVDYVAGILVAGRTLGMYLVGIRVIRVDANLAVNPLQAITRTVLLMVVVPAVIVDRDGRGLHDRVAATAVVRS